eukprot:COSAG06_NODE_51148_length_314_cov_0.665116_1_plen_35_part_01
MNSCMTLSVHAGCKSEVSSWLAKERALAHRSTGAG